MDKYHKVEMFMENLTEASSLKVRWQRLRSKF